MFKARFLIAILIVLFTTCYIWAEIPHITQPPADQSSDGFYSKYLDCNGISVKSSDKVADQALYRVNELLNQVLGTRPDLHKALAEAGVSYVIIGSEEEVTDIPEYSRMEPKEFWNERARGFGGRTTSCGEENLLNYPIDRYSDESIFIHELAHAIHGYGLKKVDPGFDKRLKDLYDSAMAKGLWKNDYASTNHSEYWAEAVQSFFNCNRENNWNHNDINTRDELEAYDPPIADLVREVFRITPQTDWQYKPLVKQPTVNPVPEGLTDEALLTRYVWCRGLPILGSDQVKEEAFLAAYDLIYNMFRYRHDILKAMIDGGLQVVITTLSDSAELNKTLQLRSMAQWKMKIKLKAGEVLPRLYVTVPQDSLLVNSKWRSLLMDRMALAAYYYTGLRPEDPDWNTRKHWQQYEIGLERMDVRFDQRVANLFQIAREKQLYGVMPDHTDRFEYWAAGVCAFFDSGTALVGKKAVNNRQDLLRLDPELADLVGEVFKHPQRVDWRLLK